MADTFKTDLIALARLHLKEATAVQWSDAELTEYIRNVVAKFSEKKPYYTSGDAYFCGASLLIDLANISNYIRIRKIEHQLYTTGITGTRRDPKVFKDWKQIGQFIEVDADNKPYTSTTLYTGTASATAAGTLTDTTLSQFDSTLPYCRVKNTTDNTETYCTSYTSTSIIALKDDIFVADETYVIEERYPVTIYYDSPHTFSETVRTFPAHFDDLILEGVIATAVFNYAVQTANKNVIGGSQTWEKFLSLAKTKLSLWHKRLDELEDLYVEETYPNA